jgi:hypothetical protein
MVAGKGGPDKAKVGRSRVVTPPRGRCANAPKRGKRGRLYTLGLSASPRSVYNPAIALVFDVVLQLLMNFAVLPSKGSVVARSQNRDAIVLRAARISAEEELVASSFFPFSPHSNPNSL